MTLRQTVYGLDSARCCEFPLRTPRPQKCHVRGGRCLQSSEVKFTMCRGIEPMRRSFCRRRSGMFAEVARLAPPEVTYIAAWVKFSFLNAEERRCRLIVQELVKMLIYIYIYIYIYTYTYRYNLSLSLSLSLHIYIYIYIRSSTCICILNTTNKTTQRKHTTHILQTIQPHKQPLTIIIITSQSQ